ncbi:SDR family NAD(P)-dependent oxidoreductase [Mycobacterium sp. 1245805.9]|uniref:SDR family NAD(P)-dependent oxidoreductase n=1 Tax=Mycobacterium sp. 1245805.9 TaxID=1856862 RepID=UPI0007FF07ED|nr:SDR family NAD(P)-dependent oxidoreductase [Mycobacterium sp. 1245805.9]OBI85786.1 oxidoreductase [Mycobacterium sp. 1245805.9]
MRRTARGLPYDLVGKVSVITGGTSGIGNATARELLRRGAKVAVLDINPHTPQIAEGLSATAAMGVVADVRSRSEMESTVANVVDRFGRVDIAVANAGILPPVGTLRVTSEAAIDSAFAVNVTGVLNTVHAAMDELITHRGQIVLISSVFAFLNGMGVIPYAMTKTAVEALGRGLQIELAAHGVTTTTAYFSLINTKMIRDGVDANPIVGQLLNALPPPYRLRLEPETAASALAEGLVSRAPRVVVPARWNAISALRGIIHPLLDARLSRDPSTLKVLAELDRLNRDD